MLDWPADHVEVALDGLAAYRNMLVEMAATMLLGKRRGKRVAEDGDFAGFAAAVGLPIVGDPETTR